MKILVFSGGLGNQLFGYAFYCWLKVRFPKQTFYGIYNHKKLSEHYGLEINKWFNVELPKANIIATLLTGLFYIIKQFHPQIKSLDLNQRICINEDALVYYAFKLTNKYIPKHQEWITWKVREENLSELNRETLKLIRNTNSVFIHIRRGDYLSPQYMEIFKNTCPLSYYFQAIADLKSNAKNLHFFFFSDDINWVKDNLFMENACYIDWNIGENSPLDMFLMSQCKYAIIANSTFSYWGAVLGVRKKQVYYPTKWINSKYGQPQIFPSDWKAY